MRLFLVIACLLIFTAKAFARVKTNEAYLLLDPTQKVINILKKNPELSFDHPTKTTLEVYGPRGTGQFLRSLNLTAFEMRSKTKSYLSEYPTPEEIEEKIFTLAESHPEIIHIEQIGTSLQGRPITAVKISDHPTTDEIEPEVKYIANMHGDEIVGRELMVLLIEELATKYKSGNPKIRSLVDTTEIYIVPSMNPDGANAKRRGNSDWIDLNRDFPDFTTRDNQNDSHGREEETKSIMEWQAKRNFSLSANFHGGAEVVNYPWDTTADEHPLHAHVLELSKQYANQVPGMRDSTEFPGGVVNGYDWYEVNGGMQDWSYYWHNDLQVTIELSNKKWPRYSEIARYWEENKIALVDFLSQVHQGIGLRLTPSDKFVSISKDGQHIGVFPVHNNEFHKVLPEGVYTVSVLDENRSEKKKIKQSVKKSSSFKKYISL